MRSILDAQVRDKTLCLKTKRVFDYFPISDRQYDEISVEYIVYAYTHPTHTSHLKYVAYDIAFAHPTDVVYKVENAFFYDSTDLFDFQTRKQELARTRSLAVRRTLSVLLTTPPSEWNLLPNHYLVGNTHFAWHCV